MRILFVCTGNTCRSPMAEAMFREKMKGVEVEIRSAGVAAADGQAASEHARKILMELGIDHQHAAQRLTEELVVWADLVLTMTRGHRDLVVSLFPQAVEKVFPLKEYVGCEGDVDIADPFGGDLDEYRQCAREMDEVLDKLQKKLAG